MIGQKNLLLITLILGLGLSTTSSFAYDTYLYAFGGGVNWVDTDVEISPPSRVGPIVGDPPSLQQDNQDLGLRVGIGYKLNLDWSIEVSYVQGPKQDVDLINYFGSSADDPNINITAEITIVRASGVYEVPLLNPIYFVSKAGVAKIEVEGDSEVTRGTLPPGLIIEDDRPLSETSAFLSAGLKYYFGEDDRAAVSVSYVSYPDASEPAVEKGIEIDFQFNF